jgi:magnesium chelatase subunit D
MRPLPDNTLRLEDPFARALACAALDPGLRSVLIFDLPPAELLDAAAPLARFLEAATGRAVRPVVLGAGDTEDELWGSWSPAAGKDALLVRQTGLLGPAAPDGRLPLVILPDLNRLGLAAARACVVLMGADVAHLERHGRRESWRPDLCWLAGCRTQDLGRLSPHLLDRFALRLTRPLRQRPDRVAELRARLQEPTGAGEEFPPLPPAVSAAMHSAANRRPGFTAEAAACVLRYFSPGEPHSPRREIALARLARAEAQLAGASQVLAAHVEQAAGLLALPPVTVPPAPPGPAPPKAPGFLQKLWSLARRLLERLAKWFRTASGSGQRTRPPGGGTGSGTGPSRPGPGPERKVGLPDSPQPFPALALPSGPYREDRVKLEREAASLHWPPGRGREALSARGPVVGVWRSGQVHDLALVSTLLEAAKYQPVRRRAHPSAAGRLLVSAADLRSYRRAPPDEPLLVLLLDYTSLRDCQWDEALMPYLRWAYVERAGVCLIQVGEAGAPNPFQATRLQAPSLLVPRVLTALEAGSGQAGQATPLAHGLELALQSLHRARQACRAARRQFLFVLLTDARGNVPLEASRAGRRPDRPITREGVTDALQVARSFQARGNVRTIFLNPQPQHHAELPLELAQALGADVVAVPARQGRT